MKTKYLLFTLFFLAFLMSTNAQEKLTQQQEEYKKNNVQIFTSEERDDLQLWFYEKVELMNLDETKKEEYYSVLLYYNVKMRRLDDKDVGNTQVEIERKLKKLIKKQNSEIIKILPEDKYKMHLENYGEIIKSIKNRMNQKNNIE